MLRLPGCLSVKVNGHQGLYSSNEWKGIEASPRQHGLTTNIGTYISKPGKKRPEVKEPKPRLPSQHEKKPGLSQRNPRHDFPELSPLEFDRAYSQVKVAKGSREYLSPCSIPGVGTNLPH